MFEFRTLKIHLSLNGGTISMNIPRALCTQNHIVLKTLLQSEDWQRKYCVNTFWTAQTLVGESDDMVLWIHIVIPPREWLGKMKNRASECLHAGNFCVRCGKGRVSRDGIYRGELCDFAGTTKGYCYPTRVQIRAHKPVAEEIRSQTPQGLPAREKRHLLCPIPEFMFLKW
jgi:hypothetical protein